MYSYINEDVIKNFMAFIKRTSYEIGCRKTSIVKITLYMDLIGEPGVVGSHLQHSVIPGSSIKGLKSF
jgi:hypothetical protein